MSSPTFAHIPFPSLTVFGPNPCLTPVLFPFCALWFPFIQISFSKGKNGKSQFPFYTSYLLILLSVSRLRVPRRQSHCYFTFLKCCKVLSALKEKAQLDSPMQKLGIIWSSYATSHKHFRMLSYFPDDIIKLCLRIRSHCFYLFYKVKQTKYNNTSYSCFYSLMQN